MSWRIDTIEIENFKFFSEPFRLELKGQNLLLFGENGSGKSSIYWSCFTHFQACGKSSADAGKYFQDGHPENLRNRYCDVAQPSGIKISFTNMAGVVHTYEDTSVSSYHTSQDALNFMRATSITSDFLNYKLISKLFDFSNSEPNDVFKVFEKEAFPVLNFFDVLQDVDGNDFGPKSIEDIWKYINDFDSYLPRNANKQNTYNQKAPQYTRYNTLLANFNKQLALLLKLIESTTNDLLKKKFNVPVKVNFEYQPPKFNEIIKGSKKSRSGKLEPPKIMLSASMDSDLVKDNSKILHPKSFFNEAKITCMGIAIRLAIMKQRTPVATGAAVMIIDDMLISLDMSLRKIVIPIILEYVEKWQLLILTHDRSLFFLYKQEIQHTNQLIAYENDHIIEEAQQNGTDPQLKEVPEWKIMELYSMEEEGKCPCPVLVEKTTYLQEAKIHLKELRIPECANSLRRACEQSLKRILPEKYICHFPDENNPKVTRDLNGMLAGFKDFIQNCKIVPLERVFTDLDSDRKLILNPFSHDDIDTPFYRAELGRIIANLEILEKVEVGWLTKPTKIRKNTFQIKASKTLGSGLKVESWVKFQFLEDFRVIKFEGYRFHTNPKVMVLAMSDRISGIKVNSVVALSKVANRIRHDLLPFNFAFLPDYVSEVN